MGATALTTTTSYLFIKRVVSHNYYPKVAHYYPKQSVKFLKLRPLGPPPGQFMTIFYGTNIVLLKALKF